jgi:hypothetical protein
MQKILTPFCLPYPDVACLRNERVTQYSSSDRSCYCGEIQQMLTFIIKPYCLKGHYRADHSIRIVEYRRKITSTLNSFIDIRHYFTHIFSININGSWGISFPSGYLQPKFVAL